MRALQKPLAPKPKPSQPKWVQAAVGVGALLLGVLLAILLSR